MAEKSGESAGLDSAETRVWLGYRRMRALLDLRIARETMRDSGLSEADYDVLANLAAAREHRCRINELAAVMVWSKSRLSHQLSRMRERGLVVREECADDGRGTVIVLTDAGRAAIEAASPSHVASVRRNFFDLLSPEQLGRLEDFTNTLLQHLTSTEESDPARGKL
ncbi:MAG TPA: MarR family winged helix-turn-helix transcriptional regulator [Pseudonocardiaceae bacterium]|nr:MarR family winged helix-turn-helix transcriptional regulator [Pseudonocardiaceae bacterium]